MLTQRHPFRFSAPRMPSKTRWQVRVPRRFAGFLLSFAVLLGATRAGAREWTEEVFESKANVGRPYVAVASRDLDAAHSVIGSARYYQIQKKDTFLDVARYYGLGYQEIEQANPGVDPWIPPAGQIILLPTEWVLPDTDYNGIVVNIPEMRLYYFRKGAAGTMVSTYPVGLGRDEWRTPQGKFKIRGKTKNPMWVLPESIKEEHRKDGRPAPDFIPGGDPENPLGKYRLELTLHSYGIHGTNIPWGVGMQVSHGCVRLYPEDIEALFPLVPIGTPGEFIYQPVKVGARDGRVYVEVHKDIYDYLPAPYREAQRLLEKFGWKDYVDPAALERAVTEQSGVPLDVTRDSDPAGLREEKLPGQAGPAKQPAAVVSHSR
jgi:L,D-transpeptidase ErfK/SrfK